jgi:hypothetical protein
MSCTRGARKLLSIACHLSTEHAASAVDRPSKHLVQILSLAHNRLVSWQDAPCPLWMALSHLPRLRSLDLSASSLDCVSPEGWVHGLYGMLFPALVHLDLSRAELPAHTEESVAAERLAAALQLLTGLTFLDLTGHRALSEDGTSVRCWMR